MAPLVAVPEGTTATLIVSAADVRLQTERIKVVVAVAETSAVVPKVGGPPPGLEVPLIPEDMINKRSDGQDACLFP